MGEVEVPEDAYYGAFTVRARSNFDISREKAHPEFIRALGYVKKAAARVNREMGLMDEEKTEAIVEAAEDVIEGKFNDEFVLDAIQAGAGTPFHMNANEVIANRATEILGGELGEYRVHPNDDVNRGQSTNNVLPTALRLAALDLIDDLLDEIESLRASFNKKADEFGDVVKVGRTHLQDAVPLTLGQEFEAYAVMCRKGVRRMENAMDELREVGLGGNAVGTGINTPEGFRAQLAKQLSKIAETDLRPAEHNVQLTRSMAPFASVSGSVRAFVQDMIQVADDLMLLSSGPAAGLAEISLPEVEPGSSIMPGKVNPSIVEAFKMACIQALGNDEVVSHAAEEGDLDMNVMAPIIAKNLFEQLKVLTRAVRMLNKQCVNGIEANRERIEELFEGSPATATALSPYIGYHRTAEVVKAALTNNRSIREEALERGLLTEREADEILDPDRMTSPSGVDVELKETIRGRLDDNE